MSEPFEYTYDGRTYAMFERDLSDKPHFVEHLRSRNFDPVVFDGIAPPTGKQRKTVYAQFYRRNGRFVLMYSEKRYPEK